MFPPETTQTTLPGPALPDSAAATELFPLFFNAVSYLFGIALAIWGLMKLKDHILNPAQVQIWEPLSRFLAGGAFLALPYMLLVIQDTVGGNFLTMFAETGIIAATSLK